MTSPTQRSLKHLRDLGFTAEVTERWNAYAKIRQDLFGFVDILAIKDDSTLAVQTTSRSNRSARLNKILANDKAKVWLMSPARQLEIHGWAKVGPRGKRKTWQVMVTPVTLASF
jgi:hypothetical protein